MRPDVYREFYDLCAADHDNRCADGTQCENRVTHIKASYMPHAMAEVIEALREENHRRAKEADVMRRELVALRDTRGRARSAAAKEVLG